MLHRKGCESTLPASLRCGRRRGQRQQHQVQLGSGCSGGQGHMSQEHARSSAHSGCGSAGQRCLGSQLAASSWRPVTLQAARPCTRSQLRSPPGPLASSRASRSSVDCTRQLSVSMVCPQRGGGVGGKRVSRTGVLARLQTCQQKARQRRRRHRACRACPTMLQGGIPPAKRAPHQRNRIELAHDVPQRRRERIRRGAARRPAACRRFRRAPAAAGCCSL